jgi:hypothetical protein
MTRTRAWKFKKKKKLGKIQKSRNPGNPSQQRAQRQVARRSVQLSVIEIPANSLGSRDAR